MLMEELLGFNEEECFPLYWDLENIILRIKERFDINECGEANIIDFPTDDLNTKIVIDMGTADIRLRDIFKRTVFSAYHKLNTIKNEAEWMELKWFVYELLRGYCPCTCRFFYDLEFNN